MLFQCTLQLWELLLQLFNLLHFVCEVWRYPEFLFSDLYFLDFFMNTQTPPTVSFPPIFFGFGISTIFYSSSIFLWTEVEMWVLKYALQLPFYAVLSSCIAYLYSMQYLHVLQDSKCYLTNPTAKVQLRLPSYWYSPNWKTEASLAWHWG